MSGTPSAPSDLTWLTVPGPVRPTKEPDRPLDPDRGDRARAGDGRGRGPPGPDRGGGAAGPADGDGERRSGLLPGQLGGGADGGGTALAAGGNPQLAPWWNNVVHAAERCADEGAARRLTNCGVVARAAATPRGPPLDVTAARQLPLGRYVAVHLARQSLYSDIT
jgi:hypothetical protein